MPGAVPRLSLEEAKSRIEREATLFPFHQLLKREALFKFVYYEKCCLNGNTPEDRVIWETDPLTLVKKDVGGYRVNTQKPSDVYSPENFDAFPIQGIWLPIESCHVFTLLDHDQECPLISPDGRKILFLIHPSSQSIYQDLLSNPVLEKETCYALSLSSYRSLLVAIPNHKGQFDFAMVKVSLDQTIEGVHRLLSMKECKISVANTAILRQKIQEQASKGKESLPISFVEDVLSYVPKGCEAQGGMLYRPLPTCLNPSSKTITVMPLLALYGVKNRDLFEKLIADHGVSLTEFLRESLFAPLSKIFVEMLVYYQTSIQAHGQNLSLVLHNNQIQGFLYRDMGGVNQLITSEDQQAQLPHNLRDYPAYSYTENHAKDVKKAFEEHFSQRALFPLTKQLCKSQKSLEDSEFKHWFDFVKEAGLLSNWTTTLPDSIDDAHTIDLPARQAFCRYGYVEAWFARVMIDCLKRYKVANEAEAIELERHFSQPEQLDDGSIVPPCSNIPFFEALATLILEKRTLLLSEETVNPSLQLGC